MKRIQRSRRLLSVAHSYVVSLNRRLVHEMARVGGTTWQITAVAPTSFHGPGEFRPMQLEWHATEPCLVVPVQSYLSQRIHCFVYGSQLRSVLAGDWDLVHCWEEPYILAGGQVAWWTRPNTPLVYRTAQSISKRYPPPFNWIERYALKRAAGWISSAQTVKQALADRPGYCNRPQRVIPLGVDIAPFQPNAAMAAETHRALDWGCSGPSVIGYLGRFVPEKGLDLLMRVLDNLAIPWRALFVGEGPLETNLQTWATKHRDRVRIVTGVTHDAVPAYLNAMDVLCAPSQTTPSWREQFGRMLIEAFACGVPVVASSSGEIPHVVQDAGIIVEECDETAWTATLENLLDSPTQRAELGARGLARARTVYAWPIVARQYLDFFEELLDYPQRYHPKEP